MFGLEVIEKIGSSHKVAVLPHISLDGDGLGSSLALVLYLKNKGIQAEILLEEIIPPKFNFLPGLRNVKIFSSDEKKKYDMVIALDSGDIERVGTRSVLFDNAEVTVNIDHHVTNKGFAQYNYIQADASSTGELIYLLLKEASTNITQDIAVCLYAAIISDTGGLKYNNTSKLTCEIVGELIETGIDFSNIYSRLLESTTLQKIKITGIAAEKINIISEKIAMIVFTKDDVKSVYAKDDDYEGIVNIARNLEGIEVCVLLREKENNEIKANIRSIDYVDVAKIASVFDGGGHKRAAGFTVFGNLEEVENRLIQAICKEL